MNHTLILLKAIADLPQNQNALPLKTAVTEDGTIIKFTRAVSPEDIRDVRKEGKWAAVGAVDSITTIFMNTDRPCPFATPDSMTLLHASTRPAAQRDAMRRVIVRWKEQGVDAAPSRGDIVLSTSAGYPVPTFG